MFLYVVPAARADVQFASDNHYNSMFRFAKPAEWFGTVGLFAIFGTFDFFPARATVSVETR